MLERLIKGKSTFSVNEWEKSHQKRQKLLKRFGVYPYILNQRGDSIEVNQFYQSKGAPWQSSTKIGEETSQKYNFPLGCNYPPVLPQTENAAQTMQSFYASAGPRDSMQWASSRQ